MEVTFDGGKVITAHINGHSIRTDQRLSSGCENSTHTPLELFIASIGLCTGVYIKSYCDQHKISTDNIEIEQNIECNQSTGLPTNIITNIKLPSDFPDEYKAEIIHIASLNSVKKAIENQPKFNIITSIK